MHQGIHWGLMVTGSLGLSKWWGGEGGGDNLPNIDVIAVGDDAAANGLDEDSASCFSGECF
jgi:hypothetical protein